MPKQWRWKFLLKFNGQESTVIYKWNMTWELVEMKMAGEKGLCQNSLLTGSLFQSYRLTWPHFFPHPNSLNIVVFCSVYPSNVKTSRQTNLCRMFFLPGNAQPGLVFTKILILRIVLFSEFCWIMGNFLKIRKNEDIQTWSFMYLFLPFSTCLTVPND